MTKTSEIAAKNVAALRARIQKYADAAPAFEAVAKRREGVARAALEAGELQLLSLNLGVQVEVGPSEVCRKCDCCNKQQHSRPARRRGLPVEIEHEPLHLQPRARA